jgi:hypothetical protein
MIKIINIIIPFLFEMLFGNNKEKNSSIFLKVKKVFVYVLMLLSFSFNYFAVTRIYNLSLNYIAVKNEKIVLQSKLEIAEADKVRAQQLEKSLEFCMANTYRPSREKTDRGK